MLSNKISEQTRSTRVNAPATSDSDNVTVEPLSTNEKASLNLSGRVGFDKPLESSSLNHENDYYIQYVGELFNP